MKGCILVNAYLKSEEYLYQANRLKDEFSALDVTADIIPLDGMPIAIDRNFIVSSLDGYDFYIYWDKDKYILSALEKLNKRVFNRGKAIETCDDKMATYIALSGYVPLIKTVPGLLCFDKQATISPKTIDRLESIIPYPIIVKEAYGSQGKGVHLAHDRSELIALAEKVKCTPHLYQEFIEESRGKDLRVIVLGGKALGGMLRDSGGKDFRSNIGAGGFGTPHKPTPEEERIAVVAAEALELDYCGVDILLSDNGPVLCEVNSNAFFRTFEKVTGINVAAAYARYILETITTSEEY